jgi:hypothetical protein
MPCLELRRLILEPQWVILEHRRLNQKAHPGIMKAYPGALEARPGGAEAHAKAMEAHPGGSPRALEISSV